MQTETFMGWVLTSEDGFGWFAAKGNRLNSFPSLKSARDWVEGEEVCRHCWDRQATSADGCCDHCRGAAT